MRPGLITRYLFRQALGLVLLVLLVVIGIILLVQFANVARVAADEDAFGLMRALVVAALRTPAEIEPVLPHVVLVGAAMAVFRFRRSGELVVIMQSGRSAPSVLLPVLAAGFVLGGAHLAVLSHVAPGAERLAAELSGGAAAARARTEQRPHAQSVVVATSAGYSFLMADRVEPEAGRIEGVTFIATDPTHRLLIWAQADEGRWTGDGWELDSPEILHGAPGGAGTLADGALMLAGIEREALTRRLAPPGATPLGALPGAIAFAESIGAPSAGHRMQLASLVALPFLLAGVAFVAGAILLAPLPLRNWVGPAGGVLLAGFGVYLLGTVLAAMGAAGLMAPWIAASATPLLCLAAGLAVLKLKRR